MITAEATIPPHRRVQCQEYQILYLNRSDVALDAAIKCVTAIAHKLQRYRDRADVYDEILVVLRALTTLGIATPVPMRPTCPIDDLTSEELSILQSLSVGFTINQIAENDNTGNTRIRYHALQVKKKLGACTYTEAVAIALRHGIIR